jgi:hypothetical protein
MKITINNNSNGNSIDCQPYGFIEYPHNEHWKLGLICYDSGKKQLVSIENPQHTWNGNPFPLRHITGTITIELP